MNWEQVLVHANGGLGTFSKLNPIDHTVEISHALKGM